MTNESFGSNPEIQAATEKAKDLAYATQSKAREALASSQQYVREHSVPIILGAVLFGAALAVILTYRERERKAADVAQSAREWFEAVYAQIADKLPKHNFNLPCRKSTLVEQAQEAGKKFKFW